MVRFHEQYHGNIILELLFDNTPASSVAAQLAADSHAVTQTCIAHLQSVVIQQTQCILGRCKRADV
jgi:hypothetical protein